MPNEKNSASGGDLVGGQGAAWNFNHGSELVGNGDALLRFHGFGGLFQPFAHGLEFVDVSDEGDHNLRVGRAARFNDRRRAFEDGPRLHHDDAGEHYRKAAAAQSH